MNAMLIQGTEIQIKEYKGQRVVTFKDIDAVHQRPEGTARKRFNDNRQRFICDADFFRITPSEFRTALGQMDNRQQNDITLITESGYLMLVKSFTDDLAWKVQRELVSAYFRARVEPEVGSMQTETYLEASRIMSGCLKDNRPYVLNILRHIIPDIDRVQIVQEQETHESETSGRHNSQGVPIDISKMLEEMGNQNISVETLAKMSNVSSVTISNWIAGKHQPVLQNRINVCVALGKELDFLTPKRTRRVQE